jgi:signal transduction histidine kinase
MLIKVKKSFAGIIYRYFCETMKSSKNSVALFLISSSIFLLLALQVLWLHNSYEKAYFDLRRQTNNLFRTSVFALRDSLLVNNIERVPNDSIIHRSQMFFTANVDTVISRKPGWEEQQRSRPSQVQIYISSGNKTDSIKRILQPIASKIQEGKLPDGSSFIVRMGMDSISTDSLTRYFKKSIVNAGMEVSFQVKHASSLPRSMDAKRRNFFRPPGEENTNETNDEQIFSNTMQSEWVRLDPVHRYSVVLSDFRHLIVGQITPQILFSLFLTLLTTAAFVIMYQSIRAQQKLMGLKNDFISNITHELKTPITTVGVAIEAIKDFKAIDNPSLTKEYLDIAQNELNRLSILTDKILKTAIFENKGIEYQPESIEFDNLVEQVLASMKLVFEKQNAKVSFEKQGADFSLTGGSVHLTSVIYNLLDNALKYCLINPEIKILLKGEATQILLSVKDNGIGIASEYKKKVFEKFFRIPTGDVHNIKGYGLGLSYVESVVKSHHGTINVMSEPGKGSNFIVTLPKS